MATQAISSYGIQVRYGDGLPLATLTITAATNATPIVVTTASPHNILDFNTANVVGVTGNTGANGLWVVERIDATHLRLRGSSGTGAYAGGGTLTPTDTYMLIAELTNVEDAGLSATLIDVSAHDGGDYMSRIPSFLNGNTMRLSVNYIPNNLVHGDRIPAAMLSRQLHRWLIVFPNATKATWVFAGYVVEDRAQAPVAGALTARFSIEMDGAPLLSAA